MKLYQLQKDTRFILTGNDWGVGEEFTFDRVEGLYARCFRPLPSGIDEIYHLRVDADVEPVKGIDLKYGELEKSSPLTELKVCLPDASAHCPVALMKFTTYVQTQMLRKSNEKAT
jgi:hypothetical protein